MSLFISHFVYYLLRNKTFYFLHLSVLFQPFRNPSLPAVTLARLGGPLFLQQLCIRPPFNLLSASVRVSDGDESEVFFSSATELELLGSIRRSEAWVDEFADARK